MEAPFLFGVTGVDFGYCFGRGVSGDLVVADSTDMSFCKKRRI